ncbi:MULTISPECIES: FdhF/YdeP family oxidoreductase [unclassified Sphingomonas]|uniref:FdhF/YdeP family oxidoreductase n=1 Tax=unclassified Sphingomonas TaxID=196159 RepID=UPI0006F2F8A9|nr:MULTISPECIES: FdhF/YdeP family oxidoreductase [unclassified Sphingomonas]KQM56925.1 formate dehydrogenase [Sphingomonas sp. Leaf16]KQN09296.1 formate dehydrogenase [Sphingomonas sp. Leaf29]KQN17475.1 formate dehydrogenase [Sphingomonas sp. Leaf32]
MADRDDVVGYDGPAGGWGSVRGMSKILGKERNRPAALAQLARQNKTKGFMCTSCAWGKPAEPHPFEFCENGAKATLWDLTPNRCAPDFFAQHSVSELKTWKDYDLEHVGRLTHPMRYDHATDHYVECSWDEAFAAIGAELRAIDPKKAIFYASGRASLETSYLYALFARLYGHNNLPDSSNMCHETTSVALKKTIGAPVGTSILDDFEHCDAMFFFGQNTGSNSPRFLHPLRDAVKRGCKVVTFNPVKEPGLIAFTDPQNPFEMATRSETKISCQYHQVRPGGDVAVMIALAKHVLAAEDRSWAEHKVHVLDVDFIEQHTHGWTEFEAMVRATDWADLERESGLSRADLEAAGQVYVEADRTIGIYGMGLTQQVNGFDNVATYVNLLLMKGNIGRVGTGMSPVRGHSNVQGQRTVGISEKPELVPMDRLRELFDFEPPMDHGHNTVTACEDLLKGEVDAFLSLGGNFLRAVPDLERIEAAWPTMRLTVQIATKLNRSHLINGKVAYLLPCLVRTEVDKQAGGEQIVTIEDTFSHIHGSIATHEPASEHLKSEVAIVAGIAKATLDSNPKVDWDGWTGDYAKIRKLIEATYPEEFHDFEERMFTPGGFYRGNAARERVWKTESGKAEFTVPRSLSGTNIPDAPGRLRLVTLRSNDQFNTTIYGYDDRFRGISGTRDVVLMNPQEIEKAGLHKGQIVTIVGDGDDGIDRRVGGLKVVPFDLPDGCIAGYYPELNPLVPLGWHDHGSQTPASKAVPVRIVG